MAIYDKKYTLEFDDVIEGEFNDYRLEIFKKYETDNLNTSDNVYVNAANNDQGLLYKGTPVYIEGGVIYRSKANDSTSMPATGIIYANLPQGSSGDVLINGMMDYGTSWGDQYAWVDSAGGLALTEPTSGVVQKIGYKSGTGTGSFFVLLDNLVTLKGTGTPINLTYNLTDDDILSPFRSSYLDISFYKENLSDDFDELFGAESDAFKVYLYKNDNLFWQGWIGTQLFSEPFSSTPYPISIRAYDGLHLLKNITYFNSPEVFQATSNLFNDRYGYHNIVDVVEKCIYNTGVLNDVFYCVNISNSLDATNPSLFPTRARVHHQTFLKGESDSMNMEEVLEIILRSLGATIYQRDGDWCFIKISDFTLNSTPSLIKRSVWQPYSSNPTSTNYITTQQAYTNSDSVSKNKNLFQVDAASTMTMQYPLKEVTIEQEFDHNMVTSTTIDSIRDLGATDPTGTYLFTEWETDGSNIQEAVVIRSNETNVSQSADLAKSFIEADAQAQSLTMNYCDSSLSYPVSHECSIDSSTIKGLKAKVKARPLGAAFLDGQAMWLLFSPELNYTQGGTAIEKGFGVSKNTSFAMLNKSVFRVSNAMSEASNFRSFFIGITASNSGTFIIKVKRNRVDFFTSSVINTNQLDSNNRGFFGWDTEYPTMNKLGVFGIPAAADYTVEFELVSGNVFPTMFQWNFRFGTVADGDFANGYYTSVSGSGVLAAPTDNFEYTDAFGNFIEGGNTTGVGANVLNSSQGVANLFQKDWSCATGETWNPFRMKTNQLNDWAEYEITSNTDWDSSISNLKLYMKLFAAALVYDTADQETAPPFAYTYDVSYTDVEVLPLVTDSIFVPKKQEYKITQSGNFSNKLTKKVKIGSGLFNTGSNRYITFNSTSGSTALKSWDTFRDRRGYGDIGVGSATIQHLVAACYMELYRVSVRRLDGTHYGNYKYGDKLQPIVGGSVETLNGSFGRFFPMNVVMDLRMARTSFSGDDLMNNTGSTWQSELTKTIKWIGNDGITETETLS